MNRLAFVDGVRALAALAVIFIHAFYEPSNGQYAYRFLYLLGAAYQRLPVDAFIVLSGFCLMLPVARRGDASPMWEHWFLRRARRILPPYYAALLLSVGLALLLINPLALRLHRDVFQPFRFDAIPVYLTLLQDVFYARFGTAVQNPPLWSIAVECRVYLLMPLILLSLRRFGSAATLLWTIAFGLGMYYAFGEWLGAASPWYVALFAMGMIAAREGIHGRVNRSWRPAAFVFAVMFMAVVLWKRAAFYNAHLPYFSIAFGVIVSLFLGILLSDASEKRETPLLRALSWKPLASLGVFSYSVYLLHYPLIRLLHLGLASVVSLSAEATFAALLCGLPLYLSVAYLFHRVAERPFMGGVAPTP